MFSNNLSNFLQLYSLINISKPPNCPDPRITIIPKGRAVGWPSGCCCSAPHPTTTGPQKQQQQQWNWTQSLKHQRLPLPPSTGSCFLQSWWRPSFHICLPETCVLCLWRAEGITSSVASRVCGESSIATFGTSVIPGPDTSSWAPALLEDGKRLYLAQRSASPMKVKPWCLFAGTQTGRCSLGTDTRLRWITASHSSREKESSTIGGKRK